MNRGDGQASVPRPPPRWALAVLAGLLALTLQAAAQGLYRYQDDTGQWHFTDRPPAGADLEAAQRLPLGQAAPEVAVRMVASLPGALVVNRYFAPIEIVLRPGSAPARPLTPVSRVVAPRTSIRIPMDGLAPGDRLRHAWVLGDPEAVHRPAAPYRAPFAVSSRHRVTQGFGGGPTHQDAASVYAVDIAMPVGTGIMAARDGVVVETAFTHFEGGLDPERHGPRANLIRILHEDGTYALYAHLDRASVRVLPGHRVRRGEWIAASGNTGYSSGPHLHFAVLRNTGMRVTSVPFTFEGAGGTPVTPRRGDWVTAYP